MGKGMIVPSASNTLRGRISSANSYRALLRPLLRSALVAHGPEQFPETLLVQPTPNPADKPRHRRRQFVPDAAFGTLNQTKPGSDSGLRSFCSSLMALKALNQSHGCVSDNHSGSVQV